MASSSDHESDTDVNGIFDDLTHAFGDTSPGASDYGDSELNVLETVEGILDDLTHVFEDSRSGASDCGDNGSEVLDENWSPGENVTIENTDDTRVKDGGVNYAPVTEHNNQRFYDGVPVTRRNNVLLNDGAPVTKHNNKTFKDNAPVSKHKNELFNDGALVIEHNNELLDDSAPVTEHNNQPVKDGAPVSEPNKEFFNDSTPVIEHNNALFNDGESVSEHNNELFNDGTPVTMHNNDLLDSTLGIFDANYTLNTYETIGEEMKENRERQTRNESDKNDTAVNQTLVTGHNNTHCNKDIIDASYTLNIGESEFMLFEDTGGERICDQDSQQDFNLHNFSDYDSQLDFSSDDASNSDSSYNFSSSEEGESTPDLADVFNKLCEVYTEFHSENWRRDHFSNELSEKVIAIGRNIQKWCKEAQGVDCEQPHSVSESGESYDAESEASSNYNIDGIVRAVFELFNRVIERESWANAEKTVRKEASSTSFHFGGIVNGLLKLFTGENGRASRENQDCKNYFGDIVKALLKLFTRENVSESGENQAGDSNFGDIIKGLLKLFTRENRGESMETQHADVDYGAIVNGLLRLFTGENRGESGESQHAAVDYGAIVNGLLRLFTGENRGESGESQHADVDYGAIVNGLLRLFTGENRGESGESQHAAVDYGAIVNGLLRLFTGENRVESGESQHANVDYGAIVNALLKLFTGENRGESGESQHANVDYGAIVNGLLKLFTGENRDESGDSQHATVDYGAIVNALLKLFTGENRGESGESQHADIDYGAIANGLLKLLTGENRVESGDSQHADIDYGAIVNGLLKLLTGENRGESGESQHANVDYGAIVNALLKLFTGENRVESGDSQHADIDYGAIANGLLKLFTGENRGESGESQHANVDYGAIVNALLKLFTGENRDESGDSQHADVDYGAIVNGLLKLFTIENGVKSGHGQNADNGFGDNVKGLLQLFNREKERESEGNTGDTAREKGGNVETGQCGWSDDDVCDVILELVDFWHLLNSGEEMKGEQGYARGAKSTKSSDPNVGNSNHKKDAIAGMYTDKELVTDIFKIVLWICSAYKEVAAETYIADDVVFCTDSTSSINNLLRACSQSYSGGRDIRKRLLYAYELTMFLTSWWSDRWLTLIKWLTNRKFNATEFPEQALLYSYDFVIKAFILLFDISNQVHASNFQKTTSNSQEIASYFQDIASGPSSPIFKFIHWLNNNSCHFINIKQADPGTNQPLEAIVSWLYNKIIFYDNIMLNYVRRAFLEYHRRTTKTDLIPFSCCYSIILLLFPFFPYWPAIITGLETIGLISPHCEYFLRNTMHVVLSWVLYVLSKKLPVAEKTCVFGKRLVKEVSVLELLCFMNTSSQISELQEIVKKLSEGFQVEDIRSRFNTEVFDSGDGSDSVVDSADQDDSVVPQTDSGDGCDSVVDLLWSTYENMLSQSNWSNGVAQFTKIIDIIESSIRSTIPKLKQIDIITHSFIPIMSGSRLDGCISLLSGPGSACDFDLMDVRFNSDNLTMESVPGHPACVAFKIGPDVVVSSYKDIFVNNFFSPDEGYNTQLFVNNYFSPKRFKSLSMEFNLWSVLLITPSSAFHRTLDTAYSQQKGDVAQTHLLFQGEDVIFSMDHVPAVVLDSWPEQADSWIHRKSDWPTRELRKNITANGCHAVPKTPKGGDPDKDWRLSFSKAENTLCRIFTPGQAFHLSLLKTQFQSVKSKIGSSEVRIFKNHTITKGEFHTYHAKTAMFWFCENHPPAHEIWKKESVFRCQSELLESMEGMMRMGHIPLYFIPEQNLLEGIPEEHLQQATRELQRLKEDARTERGRVYQQIIKQVNEKDQFSQYLSDICHLWVTQSP